MQIEAMKNEVAGAGDAPPEEPSSKEESQGKE